MYTFPVLEKAVIQVLELLKEYNLTKSAIVSELEPKGVKRHTISRVLKALEETGLAEDTGNWWTGYRLFSKKLNEETIRIKAREVALHIINTQQE